MSWRNLAGTSGVLVITGPANVGKTKLLALAAAGGVRIGLVDSLTLGFEHPGLLELATPTPLRELDQDYVDVVAVDHIGEIGTDAAQVQEAANWAAKHGKPLWLLGLDVERIEALDLELRGPIAELELSRGYQTLGLEITAAHGRQWLSLAFMRLKLYHEAITSVGEKAELVNTYWGS